MNQAEHVLILGIVWPEPKSSAAGHRMMNLIRLFQAEGWKVSFASPAAPGEFSSNLDQLGIDTYNIQVNRSEFDQFVQDLNPTIVLFDRFMMEEQFGWRVAEQCPKALRVLDTEDLHCLRRTREKAVKEGRLFETNDLLEEEISKREIASILRSDLSLIISEYEMNLLRDLFDVDSEVLCYLPFMENAIDENATYDVPGFKARRHFITIGNFSHKPNLDSVIYLKQEIWPLIHQKLPEAEMHVYGAYPTQQVEQMHDPAKQFHIKGRADDAESVIKNARVMLAPLRFGAGLKGKLLEAMRCGTPNVATDIGAEGMVSERRWSGFIANRPEVFAKRAVQLYTDPEEWRNSVDAGCHIINEKFADTSHHNDFIKRLKIINQNLAEHRKHNFTGSMLMHHTMASSRYMSRWIEEKNKK
ncbi:glycosyltransferase family 4 protein [Balneolaceae bacterium YR4-1]|uniref:Glycosyltransferase family 4 protein n=1 Tax=Halalkalibaculum roseum TaxID=2709311 RepID=A0A6M1SX53_9BACT|nr:glycosyltransferase family 4 protein [Halalkalibaculum roseum]